MKNRNRARLLSGGLLILSLGLWTGCNKGEGEKTGENIDRSADKAKEGLKEAGEKTKDALKTAADKTGDALKTAGDKLKDAAASTNTASVTNK